MKAIFTKFHGPTNFKGSRVSASDSDGNKVTISYDPSLASYDCHVKAAITLCNKMKWTGRLAAGDTRDGYVFVWVHPALKVEDFIEIKEDFPA